MGAVMQAQELRFGLRSCDLGSGAVMLAQVLLHGSCDAGSGTVTRAQEL